MEFTFSEHALLRIRDRGITKKAVSRAIQKPDTIIKESDCKHVYQKVIEEKDSKYLFRVLLIFARVQT